MLRVNNLTGFGGGGGAVVITGSVAGNVSTVDGVTHSLGNIDVGGTSSDKKVILGFSWEDGFATTISSCTVGGVSLLEKIAVGSGGGSDIGAAIWAGDISSISGSQAISVTFSAATESVGVSGVSVTGLLSLTPTMTDTDSTTASADLTLTSLAAEKGGIVFGCGGSSAEDTTVTWQSLTERAQQSTGGDAFDHMHTSAWDTGLHVAANELLDFVSGSTRSAAGAGFR